MTVSSSSPVGDGGDVAGGARPGAPGAASDAAPDRSRVTGVLLVLGSCASLQFGASAATQVFPAAGPWGVTVLRLAFAGIVLTAMARPRVGKWSRGTWVKVVLFGVSLGLMNGFFYASIARIPLGVAVTVEFLGPLLLAAATGRRARDFAWVALALAGILLIGFDSLAGATSLDPLGIVFALVAGAFWAAYILSSARVGAAVDGQGGLAVAFLVGALVQVPAGFHGAGVILAAPELIGWMALTALFGSLVPYTLELGALRRLPVGVFGILLSLEPVFAAAIGWWLLGQTPSAAVWAAVVCVVAASVGTTRSKRGG